MIGACAASALDANAHIIEYRTHWQYRRRAYPPGPTAVSIAQITNAAVGISTAIVIERPRPNVDAAETLPLKSPHPLACCDWFCRSVVGVMVAPPRGKPLTDEFANAVGNCVSCVNGITAAYTPVPIAKIPAATIALSLLLRIE